MKSESRKYVAAAIAIDQNRRGTSTDKIRTLGLYQPYAGLMCPPYNKIETRWVKKGKKAPFPLGRYLIYATRYSYNMGKLHDISGTRQYDRIRKIREEEPELFAKRGAALCVGDLVEVYDLATHSDHETFVEWTFDDKGERRMVGLIFENMKRIKPFPIKGKQGIGFLTEEQKKLIEYI